MLTHSFAFELMLVLVLLSIVLYGWTIGRMGELRRDRGWSLILLGSALLLPAALVELTHNLPELSRSVVLGRSLLEKVGFFGGFALVAVGLMQWLPQIASHRRVIRDLRRQNASLRATVEAKSNQLDESKTAAAAAHNASAAKTRFVADMIHEIRNPLSGILGLSELLLHESSLPAAREQAARIACSAEGLASLVDHVLDFSKIEANMILLEDRDFQPIEVLEQLQILMAPQAAAKGVGFMVEAANDLPALNGDPTRLLQVLLNLVGNSIKFTSEGHVAVRLERVAGTSDGRCQVRCTVTDTGLGISPRHQARLFEPFTQASRSIARRYGGTGLGLAISKSIVELMKGAISVDSEPGKGSTFAFTATFSQPRDGQSPCELQEIAPDGAPSRFPYPGGPLPVTSGRSHRPGRASVAHHLGGWARNNKKIARQGQGDLGEAILQPISKAC